MAEVVLRLQGCGKAGGGRRTPEVLASLSEVVGDAVEPALPGHWRCPQWEAAIPAASAGVLEFQGFASCKRTLGRQFQPQRKLKHLKETHDRFEQGRRRQGQ